MKTSKKKSISIFLVITLMCSMIYPVFANNDVTVKEEVKPIEKPKEEVKEEAKLIEKPKEEVKEEVKLEEKPKEETSKEEVKPEEKPKEETSKEEVKPEEKLKEETSKEEVKLEEKPKEESKEEVQPVENPKVEIKPQNIEVKKEEPLKLIKASPETGAKAVNINDEISLTFNKPVVLYDPEGYGVNVGINYDNKNNGDPDYPVGDEFYDALEIDKDNPNKVIVKINHLLEENHVYKISIYSIKEKDGDKIFEWDFSNQINTKEWIFDTKKSSVINPESISIKDIPKRININKQIDLKADVEGIKDGKYEVIPDYKVNWKSSNEEIAKIENNKLIPIKPGVVTISASPDGFPNLKNEQNTEIREIFSNQLIQKWNYKLNNNLYKGHPVISSDGSIYGVVGSAIDNKCKIITLNPDGSKKENFQEVEITTGITIKKINNTEYIFGGNKDTLLAIDAKTGDIHWGVKLNSDITTLPIVNNFNNIFVGCKNSRVYCINEENKKITGEFDTEKTILADLNTAVNSTPIIDKNGDIYIVAGDKVFCINGQNCSLSWEFQNPNIEKFISQASVDKDNNVYINDEKNIYKLTPNLDEKKASVSWQKTFKDVGNFNFIENDLLYSTVKEETDYKTVAFDFNGNVKNTYNVVTGYALSSSSGKVYTNRFIYNEDKKPIAYYDEYKNNLPYFAYSNFSLEKDETIYRFIINEGKILGVEAVSLYDTTNSKPNRIEALDNMSMYTNSEERLDAKVLDEKGANLQNVSIKYEIDKEDIAKISEDGLIKTFDKTGEVTIKISILQTNIHKEIKLNVNEIPKPTKMSFVKYTKLNTNIKDEEIMDKVSGFVGTGLQKMRVFVQDKDGNIVPRQKIKWELEDKDGILESFYDVGGSDSTDKECFYGVNITAKKSGTAVLKASLKDNPEISCKVNIEIITAPYTIKWSAPIEGDWDSKTAYHVMSEDAIYYVNVQKVKAIDKKGNLLWESKIGIDYGVTIEKPVLGKDGYLYTYSTNRTAVFKLNPSDGKLEWKIINGDDPIKDLKTSKNFVYALTQKGELYCISSEGKVIWQKSYKDNGGMLISNDDKLYIAYDKAIYEVGDKDKEIYKSQDSKLYLEDITKNNNLIVQKYKDNKYALSSINVSGKENWNNANLKDKVVLSCDNYENVYAVDYNENENKTVYILNKEGKEKIKPFEIKDESQNKGVYKPVIGADGYIYISLIGTHKIDPNIGKEVYTAKFKGAFSKTCYPKSLTVDKEGFMYMTLGELGLVATKGKILTDDNFQIDVQGLNNIKLDTLKDIKIELLKDSAEQNATKIKMQLNLYNENNESIMTTEFKDVISKEKKEYNCSVKIPKEGKYKVNIQLFKDADKEELIHEFNEEINVKNKGDK